MLRLLRFVRELVHWLKFFLDYPITGGFCAVVVLVLGSSRIANCPIRYGNVCGRNGGSPFT